MDTIEDLGRRAGTAALAAAAQVADPDDGLRRIVDDAGPLVPSAGAPRSARRPSRPWAFVAAAVAIVGIGTAAVVIAGRDDSPRLSPDPTPTPITTAPAPPTSLATTTSSEPVTTTEPSPPVTTGPIGVSYLDPPPELPLSSFASVELTGADAWVGAAVAEDGVLIRLDERSYRYVTWDGVQTPIAFEVPLNLWVAGPDQVAYGTTGDPLTDYRLAAVALGGDRAGQEVWSMPVTPGGDMLGEVPFGAWGHGPSGVTQRDDGFGGRAIAPYVDADGSALTAPIEAPEVYLTSAADGLQPEVVQSLDGSRRWELAVTAHPDAPKDYLQGNPQATPTPDGGAVIWRSIGVSSGSADFGGSQLDVFAVLRPDGSGAWYRIPDGWRVLASDLWGTVLGRAEGGALRLARPATDTVAAGGDLCSRDARTIIGTLVERRIGRDVTLDCLGPAVFDGADAPPCWVECVAGPPTGVDIGDVGELARPRSDTSTETGGFGVSLVLTHTNEWGYASYRLERWQLWPGADGILAVTSIEEVPTAETLASARATIDDYLGMIADGRYDAAAVFLTADGGTNFDERSDLAQLGATSATDVARALQAWCQGAGRHTACTRPVSIDLVPTTGLGAKVSARYAAGGRVVRGEFIVGAYEGTATVHGIPPSWMDEPANVGVTVADGAFGADRLVLYKDDGLVIVADGAAVPVDTPGPGQARIDGDYVYWTQWADGAQRSLAFRLDGEWLCDVNGVIDHIRAQADGGFVATVERPTGMGGETDETPVPNFAIDCDTGTEQPIAPISWWFEGGSRHIMQVGGTAYTVNGDVEGNATLTSADGRSITGADIALDYEFDENATTLVYGNVGGGPGVHETNRLVARDVASGEVRWSIALPRVFLNVYVYGGRIAVAHPPAGDSTGSVIESYTIVDLEGGQVISNWPASYMIADLD
jgi:hypothetical protein